MKASAPARGALIVALITACSQHASRPPDEALAPQEWVPTLTADRPAPRSQDTSSVESRLRTLADLEKKGLISSEEARQKRAEILSDL